jgi:hypothetical protein
MPLICIASSEARKAIVLAISSGDLLTPSTGIIFLSNLVSISLGRLGLVDIGVSMEAGHTQFTLSPRKPYSTAKVLEKALIPPLEAL